MSTNERRRLPQAGSGLVPGDIVGSYELQRLIGLGGMGEVHLARHVALGVLRAIKIIRADLRGRYQALERFTREAQVLARLQHNGIVQIIEFGSLGNGWPFLAMEYIDGPNLEQMVASAPLSLPSALTVLEQIAVALDYAHQNNVFHRDLSPANVLVRFGDVRQVKVIDFGFARVLDADGERLTSDGQTFGAPAYMAPEQADGVRDVTSAVDIYGFGCLAYLILSGRPPFQQKRRLEVMAAHLNDRPPRLSTRCPGVPQALDDLLFRCLSKVALDRPTAAVLVTQLGELVRGGQLESRPASPSLGVVDTPWSANAGDSNVDWLDAPIPADPEGRGLTLAMNIMSIIEEIATHLSTSDPELTPLLRLEARICEKLAAVERELHEIDAQLELTPGAPELVQLRDAAAERLRTLNAQQLPLQRNMVQLVDAYRAFATGEIQSLFRKMDQMLRELSLLRKQYPHN